MGRIAVQVSTEAEVDTVRETSSVEANLVEVKGKEPKQWTATEQWRPTMVWRPNW